MVIEIVPKPEGIDLPKILKVASFITMSDEGNLNMGPEKATTVNLGSGELDE